MIPATRKSLAKAGIGFGDLDWIEINEAFACVPLAWGGTLGLTVFCIGHGMASATVIERI